jgi:hypothetical protein
MVKATKAEVTQRVEEVLGLRLAGAGYPEILQHSAEKGWGLHERQLREYIARSDELLAGEIEKDRPKRLSLHLAQRRLLFNRTMETGDYSTALRILQDSAKLQDLYPPKRSELTGANGSDLPPLSAVVLAIVQAEANGGHEQREQRRIEADGIGGTPVPALAELLRDDVLSDSREL